MRRALVCVVTVTLLTTAVVAGPLAAAGDVPCNDVVSSARATSTVGRVDAANGAALAAPAYYSQLIYDSIPQVAYDQSGPVTTGQLEDPTGTNPQTIIPTVYGFLPVDPPPDPEPFPDGTPYIPAPPVLGRAEAAYPTLQGIPQDDEGRAGTSTSEAHAYPTYARGRASGGGVGDVDGGYRTGTAFTSAVFECETLTLVVGWEATGVVTATGTIPSVSQIATLVISPSGASADVATNVAEETEEGQPVIDGRPLDPVFDPFNQNGTYVDVGEPRITVEDGFAKVEGGGIRYGTADPSRNDTYTFYTLGSLLGEVTLLSVLPAAAASTPDATSTASPADTPASPPGSTTAVVGREVGDPPTPSAAATTFAAAQVQGAAITEDLVTGSETVLPALLGVVAAALIARVLWVAADRARRRFPTAGFAVDRLREGQRRFRTTYLTW
jgi:hypothetical protein